jgi:hypothetical protein
MLPGGDYPSILDHAFGVQIFKGYQAIGFHQMQTIFQSAFS